MLELPANAPESIVIQGARVHNLKNLSLAIPLNQIVALTGVSGSGKSSLAFDLLFGEGQRRYLESLSARARQALSPVERGDFDHVDGLPATICIDQRAGGRHLRSTLATLTEIADFLRLLYARAGQAHCPHCGRPVSRQTPDQICDRILASGDRQKAMLLAPLVRGRKGEHVAAFESIIKNGFVRARVDGQLIDAASPPPLARSQPHTIEVVVDRIVVKEGIRPRLAESVHSALRHGEGQCIVSLEKDGGWNDLLFSETFACPDCGIGFPELEPRTLSFNSPAGACPRCDGLGVLEEKAPDAGATGLPQVQTSGAFYDMRGDGSGPPCPECRGARIHAFARSVTFDGKAIHEVLALSVAAARDWCHALSAEIRRTTASSGSASTLLASGDPAIAASVWNKTAPEILSRLEILCEIGLGYLTLDRASPTLSGGELQRARLASALGRNLSGVCYLLDEPTAGLHPVDTQRLIDVVRRLHAQENSVLIVEHDMELVRQCDWVIDLGPGAGQDGGQIVAVGTPSDVARNPLSVTGRFLKPATSEAASREAPDSSAPEEWLTLSHARRNNLQDVTLRVPLGRFVAVTGVSGSGKSTLIRDTLAAALRKRLEARGLTATTSDADAVALTGGDSLRRMVLVDQTPLGRNSRSTPATYSGVWDEVRRLLAKTKEARLRGFTSQRFSFGNAAGRCATCRGLGQQQLRLDFLPPMSIDCPTCRGRRFNPQTLTIRFGGKNAAEILALRVDEAIQHFQNVSRIRRPLETMREIGLGYLTLGQSATTLSGGEAQRVKLATELARESHEPTLFLLDEPTTGLHPADVERLIRMLRRLVERGQTVLVIEHQLDLIAAADWIIDLGPGAGTDGGRIIAEGSPSQILATASGATADALRKRQR